MDIVNEATAAAALISSNGSNLEALLDAPFQTMSIQEKELPLAQFCGKLNSSKRLDYASPMNQMHVSQIMPDNSREDDTFALRLGTDQAFGLSPFAFKQLNQKLGTGFGSYASFLIENNEHALYLDNVNELLRNSDKQAQVRTLQNGSTYARAIVSDKYARFDDSLVFRAAFDVLKLKTDDYLFLGGNRTDTRTYFKVVSKKPLFELEIGGKTRPFYTGFIISNSEVGLGNVTFQAFCCDGFCTNGLIFGKEILKECKIKHIGRRIEKQFGLIGKSDYDNSRQLEVSNFITQATDFVTGQNALSFQPLQDKLIDSSKRKLMGSEDDSIRNILSSVGIAKSDHNAIIGEIDTADDSQFGLQAGITQYAQSVSSYENRIDLEKKGGDVIDLTSKQWDNLQVVESA